MSLDIKIYKTELAKRLTSLQTTLNSYKLEANLGINLRSGLKEEAFLILKGRAILRFQDKDKEIEVGDMFKIPANTSFKILALTTIKFIRSTKTDSHFLTEQKESKFDKIEFKEGDF